MATLRIPAAWLNPADNPALGIEIGWQTLGGQTAPRGEVRMLATGAKRAVEWPGLDESITLTIPYMLYSELRRVESWQGQSVVWRDASGRIHWCRIQQVATSDSNMFDDKVNAVSLTLTPVTNTARV